MERIPEGFSRKKGLLIWLFAIALTISSAIYQRYTGPTYPMKGSYIANGKSWSYKLTRNPTTDAALKVILPGPDTAMAQLIWLEYPTGRSWKTVDMNKDGGVFRGTIPVQPTAGKVEFYIRLSDNSPSVITIPEEGRSVIARYKDPVPSWALIPHIILMFTAMLVSNRLGLGLLYHETQRSGLIITTVVTLILGGLVFGPFVQHYAFGVAWTGWPVGNDLTDNKSALAVIAWLIPVFSIIRKKDARRSTMIAAVLTLAVYLIPHSLFGSQHHYTN